MFKIQWVKVEHVEFVTKTKIAKLAKMCFLNQSFN